VDPQNTLVLSELPATAGIAPAPHEIGLTGHRGPARRRNLVIVRADENSLHPQWDRNIPDLERNWDVCVSFYGKDEDFSRADFVQYHVHQHEKRKYPSIFELLTADRLWDYDFFMIIDDDVMLSWLDLNVAFEVCREHRLDLAQPSLTPDSFWSHALTVQQPGLLLRFVGYVEGMAAIFSKEALRTCLPTFERSQFGWGIDVLWPLLLGRSDSRVAVIDRVAIRHTRPVGATYDGGVAKVEGDRFLEEYGCRTRYIELGSLRGSTIAWGSPQVGP
jgi:hypothetical protein